MDSADTVDAAPVTSTMTLNSSQQQPRPTRCPVCEQPATLVEGRYTEGWCRVDGCLCGGFFVAADALEWRLPRLSAQERGELSVTIQGFRAMGRDPWLSIADGGISGRLVIRGKPSSDASSHRWR